MADQDEVTQGAIPPKVSPFAKPEGAAPITPAAPGAPRPITVRLKPVAPAPAEAAAPAAAAPAAPAVGIPAAPPASPRATSRVPVPEGVSEMPAAIRPATVRLRPVAAPTGAFQTPPRSPASSTVPVSLDAVAPSRSQVSASSTVPISLDAVQFTSPTTPAASPLTPQHPPTPGANPLPDGPKPPSSAQVQAAKSKTSRISLDSAIGVAPVGAEKEGPKTIRLKRPSDLATPTPAATVPKSPLPAARQTSRIPDSALPTVEAAVAADSASVTQKKTLKIKRPGAKEEGAEAAASAGAEGLPEGMTPISAMEFPAVKEESSVFTVITTVAAAAAVLVLLGLVYVLAAHAVGSVAGKNAVAFRHGPDLPCVGRLAD